MGKSHKKSYHGKYATNSSMLSQQRREEWARFTGKIWKNLQSGSLDRANEPNMSRSKCCLLCPDESELAGLQHQSQDDTQTVLGKCQFHGHPWNKRLRSAVLWKKPWSLVSGTENFPSLSLRCLEQNTTVIGHVYTCQIKGLLGMWRARPSFPRASCISNGVGVFLMSAHWDLRWHSDLHVTDGRRTRACRYIVSLHRTDQCVDVWHCDKNEHIK